MLLPIDVLFYLLYVFKHYEKTKLKEKPENLIYKKQKTVKFVIVYKLHICWLWMKKINHNVLQQIRAFFKNPSIFFSFLNNSLLLHHIHIQIPIQQITIFHQSEYLYVSLVEQTHHQDDQQQDHPLPLPCQPLPTAKLCCLVTCNGTKLAKVENIIF